MNVPQLRFSGFDGEWETFELKKLVKLEGGATPLKSEKKYWQDGHIPWVSSQEVGPKKLDKTTFNITEAAVLETSTKMVDKDTLLLVVRSGILVRKIPLSITAVPMAINQDIKAMIIKDGRLHYLFLYQWMKKNEKAMLSNVVKGGTTVQSVNTPDLQDYLIGIPSINEQKKIAEFFELIDKKTENLKEKIMNLEHLKKGIMQKVFMQELRFKNEDGGEFEEWEERTLDSFVKVGKAGGTPLSSNRSYYNGEIPFLSIKDITNQGKFITNTEKYINEQGLKNSSAWVVPTNSLIYSMYASVGFVCINKLPISTSQAMYSMVLKDASSLEFLYYYLSYFRINGIKKFIETGTQGNLNANTVKNILIPSPSLKEQEKIGKFLSKIDIKIDREKEKLMVLEEQKRGFMQGIFV